MQDGKCTMNSEQTCIGLEEVRRVANDLKALEERNGKDHKEFREKLSEIEKATIRQAEQFSMILQTLSEIKQDNKGVIAALGELKPKAEAVGDLEAEVKNLDAEIDKIKEKPAKKWDSAVDKVIMMVIGAVAAYILAKVGL